MKVEKLIDVVQIKNPKPEKFSGEKRYYSTGNIDEHDVSENFEIVKFENRPSRANVQPIENSVGFAKMKSTAKTLLVTKNYSECIFSTGMNFLLPSENIISKYLYYYLISPYFFDLKDKYSGQGIMGGLSNKDLNLFKIPVPSLQEQEKIVERLDKAFANIDSLILKTKKNLEYLSNVFNSELKNLFPHPEDSDPTLGSLSKITSSKRIYKSDYVEEGIPFYRTKEIKELANNQKIKTKLFIDDKKYNELLKNFGAPLKGDVLITAIGTIGEIYVVENKDKFYFKDGNIIWIKELKGIEPYFLKYSLMSFVNKLNKLSHGAAYNALSIEKLKSFKVQIPSLDEQSQIVSKLNNLNKILNKLVDLNLNKINQLNLLKKSMLRTFFSSKSIKEVA